MTKTYMINAWCIRPFIAGFDIEAETPEQAIATARQRQDQLLGTAEECNSRYPWDEFSAYDESGNELLHVLDGEARLRHAVPALVEALVSLATTAADLDAAIDGVTDQFDDERTELLTACDNALAAIAKARAA
jgi:hypothetical protein